MARNPLFKYGISYRDFDKLPEVNAGVNDFMAKRVVPAWKSNSPRGKGKKKKNDERYVDSVQVTERSVNRGRGVVGATSKHAHFVEFGTAKTPEFAPAEKTAKQFGGYAHDKPAG